MENVNYFISNIFISIWILICFGITIMNNNSKEVYFPLIAGIVKYLQGGLTTIAKNTETSQCLY